MIELDRKILIFDFDGTIAESGRGIMHCAGLAMERLGKPVPGEDVLRRFVGPPLFTSFRDECGLSDEEATLAVQYYRERYESGGLFEADIYPGITPMLRALKASGAYMAVASGKPAKFLVRIIEHFGLTPYFEKVVGPDPSSHSSDKAAQILAALPEGARPEDAWMIGDRCFDVDSAHALGMTAVAVGYGYGSAEEFARCGAEKVAMTVRELSELLLDGQRPARGQMITFEGSDGCGKSTQMKKLSDWLRGRGYEVVCTREPGGCPISESIREIILSLDSAGMSAECEALLYAAARVQHVKSVLLPALEAGKMVLCDRFLDSSIAYQAYGRELGEDFIRQINRKASELAVPDRTLLFDVPRATARERMAQGAPLDRLEREAEDFFARVARGYDAVAEAEPGRVRRIDSGRSIDEVFDDVLRSVDLN